jgi:Tol biopolymer transport system component
VAGQRVAFESFASNLVSGDSNGYKDVFFRSLNSGNTSRVSVDSDGDQANGESFDASISGDGRYVAFTSLATNLVSDDDNGYPDVFIRDCNQEKTRPGSTFTFSGANYTPSGAFAVWVNGSLLGTGMADTGGNLAFQVCTESGTDEGGYFATVIQGETELTAGFLLAAGAPVRRATGNDPTFCVPDGIAYTEFSYLPLAFR